MFFFRKRKTAYEISACLVSREMCIRGSPDSGQVLIDGQDLTDLTLDSYRREVSYCPQNPIMFNVSVLENLRYSDINKYFYKKPYVLSLITILRC